MDATAAADVVARHVRDELELETQRKRALLQRCGVAEEDLSRYGQMYLHVLAEVAELLGLKDTKSSSYLLAMADFEDTLERTEQEMRATRAAVAESARRSQELERERELLERTKQQLEAASDERERHENTATIEQRAVEYRDKERAYDAELSQLRKTLQSLPKQAGATKLVEHRVLSALEAECIAIEAENRALQAKLAPYHDLPLSRDLAAAQLHDARAELERLDDQFSAQIQQML